MRDWTTTACGQNTQATATIKGDLLHPKAGRSARTSFITQHAAHLPEQCLIALALQVPGSSDGLLTLANGVANAALDADAG